MAYQRGAFGLPISNFSTLFHLLIKSRPLNPLANFNDNVQKLLSNSKSATSIANKSSTISKSNYWCFNLLCWYLEGKVSSIFHTFKNWMDLVPLDLVSHYEVVLSQNFQLLWIILTRAATSLNFCTELTQGFYLYVETIEWVHLKASIKFSVLQRDRGWNFKYFEKKQTFPG